MAYVIITLILIFGLALTGIGIRLVRGQRRMEHRQTVALAALRAAFGAPPLAVVPDQQRTRPVLTFIKGGAAPVIALLFLARRHIWRAVGVGASVAAAGVVAGALAVGQGGASGAPTTGTGSPSIGLTGATASRASVPPSTTPGSAPSASFAASAPPPASQTIDVFAAEPQQPAQGSATTGAGAAPSTPVPTQTPPARSPSASSSAPSPAPSCLVKVTLPPILGVCLL